jgi:uncharacterized protein (TIGR02118 family)
MIKLIVAIKRRAGMSPEDFQAYWKASHATKVKASACGQRYIRRYIQCHTLLADYAQGEPAFDGTAELWFDSVADREAFFTDPEYLSTIAPDETKFADMTETKFFQTEEYSVI